MCSFNFAAIFLLASLGGSLAAIAQPSVLGESHPYQDQLSCDRAPGSTLVGVLYRVTGSQRTKIAEYNTLGHVGACEMAIRAARDGRVCVYRNWQWQAIEISSNVMVKQFGTDFDACLGFTKGWQLHSRKGFVEFIDAQELNPLLANLPHVDNEEIEEVLHSRETMWYDEASMVFTYQDSFGHPQGPEGLRANRVAYDVGSNSSVPDIRALTEYFEHGKFRFPFSIAAGADFKENVYVLNFWSPPQVDGERLPVVWWENGSHWHWVFPVGTVIGEVLLLRAPDEREWYVYEVRSRSRRLDGWTTDVFRPFVDATEMAQAIRAERPEWMASDLKKLVDHLEATDTLQPASLESKPYREAFDALHGSYDYLPETSDRELIKSFLRTRTFSSAMGKVWKRHGSTVTYAASSKGDFQIVPKGYIGGLLETSEEACSNCHVQTGRPLGQIDSRTVLYGEVWGEDQIFTWHPFAIDVHTFSITDNNRHVNKRLVAAGLLEKRRPGSGDPLYRELPKPYPAEY